jgi:hypothetical protein
MNITYLKWTGRIMLAVIALGSTGMASAQTREQCNTLSPA